MNAVSAKVRQLVDVELAAANERFPQFHSQHEGWAIIKEEVDELEEALIYTKLTLNDLWEEIKRDRKAKSAVQDVFANAINAACEAIQVAAMCQKFLDMEGSIHDGEGNHA